MGVDTLMPTSISESLDALEQSIEEKRLLPLGEGFLKGFLAHKRSEHAHFKEKPEADNRQFFTNIW